MDEKINTALKNLYNTLGILLGPQGCPWDKLQTPLTLAPYLLEETHELVDRLRHGSLDEIADELGDVLHIILFLNCLYTKKDGINLLAKALNASAAKLRRRHPHVFGEAEFQGYEKLSQTWEEIKRKETESKHAVISAENESASSFKSIFASLPGSLPPLYKAYRLHSKAARNGFTWKTFSDAVEALENEGREFLNACLQNSEAGGEGAERRDEIFEEYGDYLFTLVEVGRRMNIKASEALEAANEKFLRRFQTLEHLAYERNQDLSKLDEKAWNNLWDEVKSLGK